MTQPILVGLLSAVFLWLIWSYVRVLFHDVDDAVAYVAKRLHNPNVSTVSIEVWQSRPLTENQIKELAENSGFRYLQDTSGRTFRSLSFERRVSDV